MFQLTIILAVPDAAVLTGAVTGIALGAIGAKPLVLSRGMIAPFAERSLALSTHDFLIRGGTFYVLVIIIANQFNAILTGDRDSQMYQSETDWYIPAQFQFYGLVVKDPCVLSPSNGISNSRTDAYG